MITPKTYRFTFEHRGTQWPCEITESPDNGPGRNPMWFWKAGGNDGYAHTREEAERKAREWCKYGTRA